MWGNVIIVVNILILIALCWAIFRTLHWLKKASTMYREAEATFKRAEAQYTQAIETNLAAEKRFKSAFHQ